MHPSWLRPEDGARVFHGISKDRGNSREVDAASEERWWEAVEGVWPRAWWLH